MPEHADPVTERVYEAADGLRVLLDEAAVEVEVKHTIFDRRGSRRERPVQHAEEEQEQQQDERVLYADEQFPNRAHELHGSAFSYLRLLLAD